jgi:hypothetical protein
VEGWENAESGFAWVNREGKDLLEWAGAAVKEEDELKWEWRGWMVCPWVHGHPQLFWVTGMLDKALPPVLRACGYCKRMADS